MSRPHGRSLIAALAVVVGLTVYALLAMRLSAALPGDGPLGFLLQLLYYVAAGLVWVVPAARVIRWAVRGDH
jgi:hypothetical protein